MNIKALIPALMLIACAEASDQPAPASADSAGEGVATMPPPLPRDTLAGGRTFFEPGQLFIGAEIAGLKVARLSGQPAPLPTNYSGSIRFDGEVEVNGIYRAHYDYPEVKAPCFFVNEGSWPKLPRARGDTRILWFCFENDQQAIRQLGELGTQTQSTIVIDNYTTNLSGSDVWDTAKLVRVVSKGQTR